MNEKQNRTEHSRPELLPHSPCSRCSLTPFAISIFIVLPNGIHYIIEREREDYRKRLANESCTHKRKINIYFKSTPNIIQKRIYSIFARFLFSM